MSRGKARNIMVSVPFDKAVPKMMNYLGYRKQIQLAKFLGLQNSSITNEKKKWEKDNKPTVPPEWILTFLRQTKRPLSFFFDGEEEDGEEKKRTDEAAPTKTSVVRLQVIADLVVPYGIEEPPGPGLEGGFKVLLEVPGEWVDRFFSPKQRPGLRILVVQADNMEPTIRRGGVILIDMGDRNIFQDGIFAFLIHDSIKIFRISLRKDGRVDMIQDNQAYPSEAVTAGELNYSESIRVVGRVVFKGNRV